MTAPQDPYQTPPAYGTPPAYTGGVDPYAQPGGYGQPPTQPGLANWGYRAGGYLIDGVLTFVIALVVSLVIGSGAGQVVNAVIYLFVFGYLNGTSGQTPGKMAVGIKVLSEQSGGPIGVGAGIGRQFGHIVDTLALFLGWLWPIWDAKNQTFADKFVHSVVVRTS